MQKGIIVKSTGSWYQVRLEDGTKVPCRIFGKFRLGEMKLTNPVAVGDFVDITLENDGADGMIKKIHPRRNYVARQSPHQRMYLHLLAANIDQALIFLTVVSPNLKQGFIDRYLLMIEPYNIPAILVFNKADLYDDEAMNTFEYLKFIYQNIGYTVLLVSALQNTGIAELKALLQDKTTLVSGQSGVGKSTLINAIQPQLDLRTEEISDHSGKGQHTTTFAEMFALDFGGNIIDTPGIKSLSFNNLTAMDVTHNFREFFELSKDCRFSDCQHRNEPKCAVKDALEAGKISPYRYANYLDIIANIDDLKFWEMNEM